MNNKFPYNTQRKLSDHQYMLVKRLLDEKVNNDQTGHLIMVVVFGMLTIGLAVLSFYVFRSVNYAAGIATLIPLSLMITITHGIYKQSQRLDDKGYGDIDRRIHTLTGKLGTEVIKSSYGYKNVGAILPTVSSLRIITLPEWESFMTYSDYVGKTVTVEYVQADDLHDLIVISITGLDIDREVTWHFDTY